MQKLLPWLIRCKYSIRIILRIALMTVRAMRQVSTDVKCYFLTQHLLSIHVCFDPQSTLLVVALWSSSSPFPYTCADLARLCLTWHISPASKEFNLHYNYSLEGVSLTNDTLESITHGTHIVCV